ncbi:MAG: hypothetical protein RL291_1358, partial [Pseudomonadota bacterium]
MMSPIHDPVPFDTPGARAIGFEVPERYNAASMLFDNLARGRGAHPAIIGPGGARSYAELCADAAQVGNALKAIGLEAGARVICLLDDTPAYAAVIFGAMRAGFVPVLLNTLSPPDLIEYYAQDSSARVAFVQDELFAKLGEAPFIAAGITDLVVAGRAPLVGSGQLKQRSLSSFINGQAKECVEAPTHRNDMAFW